MPYPLVTICGSYHLTKDWVLPCLESWKKISNIDRSELYVIPDNRISEEDVDRFRELQFTMLSSSNQEKIEIFLTKYPYLTRMREKELFWKKIVDISILFSRHEKVVYIDTDVFINHPVLLPEGDFDIAYMREEIPAYHGKWSIVWKERMVPALQGGLVIFRPSIIDFDYLEYLAKDYFINCKDTWWTEQAAWACIAGKSEKRYVFNGKQVRVISGINKRTLSEIVHNKFKYFGSNKIIEDFEIVKCLVEGSSIVHFAGMGKKWALPIIDHLQKTNLQSLEKDITLEKDTGMTFVNKSIISLRLFLQEKR